MKFLQLEQRSQEWLDWREKGIGASDIPAICGICPYRSPQDVLDSKYGMHKVEITPWMQRGIDGEPLALEAFNKLMGQTYIPVLVEGDNPLFLASLDGYCEEDNTICEIKIPGEKKFHAMHENNIPLEYIYQIHWQMHVTKCLKAYLFVYHPESGDYLLVEIKKDQNIIDKILSKVEEFIKAWKGDTKLEEEKQERYISKELSRKILAEMYAIKEEEKKLAQQYKSLQEMLTLEEGDRDSLTDGHYRYVRTKRQGVDYKKACQDHKLDLKPYSKPVTISWTIKKIEVKIET